MVKLTRRQAIALGGAGIATGAAAFWYLNRDQGSGPTGGPDGGPWSLEAASRPYRESRLRLIGEDYAPMHAVRDLAPQFTARTGIQVDVDLFEAETVLERVQLGLNSQRSPYDLIAQVYFDMGQLAARERIMSIADYLADARLRDPGFDPDRDLFPIWRTMGWYNERPYGLPLMVLTMYIWYRKDLFENAANNRAFRDRFGRDLAPPRTWTEYSQIAEFFTRPAERLYGTLIQGRRHIALWQEFLNFLYSFGGGVLDTRDPSKYGDIIINSPQSVEALNYYRSLVRFSPPDTLSYTWDDALAAMQQGRVAMCVMWSDATSALEDETQSRVAGKMGFAQMPAGRAGSLHQIGGQSFYIPTTSASPEAAFLFMQWYMNPQIQIEQQVKGGASPRPSTFESPTVQSLPWTNATLQALASTYPAMLYTFPESLPIGEIIKLRVSEALAGQRTAQQSLDLAAADLERLLEGKARRRYR